jgi:DNA invertase Pin-like site-specific DNA recombinase
MSNKIQSQHLSRLACIYLRQSTPGQVRHHQESTERQYALQQKAQDLGWRPDLVRVLDADLGLSGKQSEGREDFVKLVADVSMGRVGAVFALEASRLARCCADWHRLLELAALAGTLIIDEDGVYDPADFNDQLLLGLKGTMSQAELHFLRGRLQGGKLNKAKKGELHFPLPVGFCCDELGRTILDPDQQVQNAVRLVFESFRQTGSAYGVVHHFADHGLSFPKRAYGGTWDGKLLSGSLTHARVLGILKNPAYAGVYVYGRYRYGRVLGADGKVHTHTRKLPMQDWTVRIENHHPAYIDWQMFLANQAALAANRVVANDVPIAGPAREGLALLQGLLLCGICGRRLSVRYTGNGGIYPTYECTRLKRDGLASRACLAVRCDVLDGAIAARILQVVQPQQIELALAAIAELCQRQEAIDRQWQMRLQRAEYEADLAQRRYEQVDPANRLVAATLEQQWNETLTELQRLRQEDVQRQDREAQLVGKQQEQELRRLGRDLPGLWLSGDIEARDRKRILRLLIKDITVQKLPRPKRLVLHVRWQGGACEDLEVQLPLNFPDRLRYPTELVDEVRRLAQTQNDEQIARELNRQGRTPAKGQVFTIAMVKWVRYHHRIPSPALRRPEELTVQQVARQFGVSIGVVYYWIARKVLPARRINCGSPWWITLDTQKEEELNNRVRNSLRIGKRSQESQRQIVAGAL